MRSYLNLALLLALSMAALAADDPQQNMGTIIGTVLMPDGKPAVDCVVTAQQNAEKMRQGLQATTDADGKFKIENVPEGAYNLNVRTRDLKGRAIKSLSVLGGRTTDIGKLTLKMK